MSVNIWIYLWSIFLSHARSAQYVKGSWVDDFVYISDTADFSTADVYNDGWYVMINYYVHIADFKIKPEDLSH